MSTVERLLYANSPEEFFGELNGATPIEQISDLRRKYDKAALLIHPQNKTALKQLGEYFEVVFAKLESEASPPPPDLPQSSDGSKPILIAQGDLADIYRTTYPIFDTEMQVIAKTASDPSVNDLLQNEAQILSDLQDKQADHDVRYYANFLRYLPRLLDEIEDNDLQINFLEPLDDFYSLEQVHEAYPDGVEFQTAVWFFNRILEALGFIHREGIIHGAILPAHIMIHPKDHAAKIIDWTAAVVNPAENFEHISVISDAYEDCYPAEVFERQIPSPATDIYMAAKCIVYILGGNTETNEMPTNVPDYLQNFIRSCLLVSAHQRPKDAWKLRDEFAAHIKRHYGPPKYHEFKMPSQPRYNVTTL